MIGIFLYGFITVITLIGITNIFNTITTSVYLRKREFATLRSVGMTNKEFNKMIRLESFFIGAKALIFGVPLGIILCYFMNESLDTGLAFVPPFKTILITILAVFLLIFIIMNYSLSKIKSQNTIETIRNENI
jgi:putative ABC transport system permease protein